MCIRDRVNTEHIVIGEGKSAIYDEYIVTALVNVDVFAYLVYACLLYTSGRLSSFFSAERASCDSTIIGTLSSLIDDI